LLQCRGAERTHACSQLLQFPSLPRLAGRKNVFFPSVSTPRCSAVLAVTVLIMPRKKGSSPLPGWWARGRAKARHIRGRLSSQPLSRPRVTTTRPLSSTQRQEYVRTMECSRSAVALVPPPGGCSCDDGMLRSMPRTPVLDRRASWFVPATSTAVTWIVSSIVSAPKMVNTVVHIQYASRRYTISIHFS
jgi:hypothetical protein